MDNDRFEDYLIGEFKETREKIGEVKDLIHEKFSYQKEYCSQRQIDNSKTFLQSKVFFWVIGFVIVGIIALSGYTSTIKTDVDFIKEKHRIEESVKK